MLYRELGNNLSAMIAKNRRDLIQVFSEKYTVTEAELAEFFQVPIKVIRLDLNESNIILKKENEPFPLEKEKRLYSMKVSNLQRKGMSKEEALAECGFWADYHTFIKSEKEKVFQGFYKEQILRMQKAVALSEYGYTISDIKEIVPEITKVEMAFLKKDAEEKGIIFGKTNQDHFISFAKERYEQGDGVHDIKRAVGVSATLLEKGENYHKITQKNREKYIQNNPHKIANKEVIKEECYQKWMSGEYTQQELADQYEVTRITVMNWIREKKIDHIEEIEDPILRRRNIQHNKKVARDELKEKYLKIALPELQKGKSVNTICLEYHINNATLSKFLREEGLISTKYESRDGINAMNRMTELKEMIDSPGYPRSKNILFGYGPNAGITKQINIGQYGTANSDLHNLKYELQHEEKAKEYFEKHDGEMFGYWQQKKQQDTSLEYLEKQKKYEEEILEIDT